MTPDPTGPAQVALSNPASVVVTRRFAAPCALVVRAYTDPALLRRWLVGPPGWEMTVCEMDARVGGAYRWQWRQIDTGTWFGFTGRFLAVDLPDGYLHTQLYDPGTVGGSMGGESRVAITFLDEGGATRVTTTVDFGDPATRDASLATGMTGGMEMSYARLDALIPEIVQTGSNWTAGRT